MKINEIPAFLIKHQNEDQNTQQIFFVDILSGHDARCLLAENKEEKMKNEKRREIQKMQSWFIALLAWLVPLAYCIAKKEPLPPIQKPTTTSCCI